MALWTSNCALIISGDGWLKHTTSPSYLNPATWNSPYSTYLPIMPSMQWTNTLYLIQITSSISVAKSQIGGKSEVFGG